MDIKNILKIKNAQLAETLAILTGIFPKIRASIPLKRFLHMGKLKKCDGYIKKWVKIGTAARDRNVCSGARSAKLILRNKKTEIYETK